MKLYETYAAQREHFEILAFHDATVSSFEELEEKLVPIREKYWEGNRLPFPVLLDATGDTLRAYGISAFPTHVLLDPEGNVVKGNGEKRLEEALEALATEAEEAPHSGGG
ncbi:MAG: thioredoxin domain-containing protein [Planctomycetota bacterium]|jgi:hypothetical protein